MLAPPPLPAVVAPPLALPAVAAPPVAGLPPAPVIPALVAPEPPVPVEPPVPTGFGAGWHEPFTSSQIRAPQSASREQAVRQTPATHDCPEPHAGAGHDVKGRHLPPLHSCPLRHCALLLHEAPCVALSFLVEQPHSSAHSETAAASRST